MPCYFCLKCAMISDMHAEYPKSSHERLRSWKSHTYCWEWTKIKSSSGRYEPLAFFPNICRGGFYPRKDSDIARVAISGAEKPFQGDAHCNKCARVPWEHTPWYLVDPTPCPPSCHEHRLIIMNVMQGPNFYHFFDRFFYDDGMVFLASAASGLTDFIFLKKSYPHLLNILWLICMIRNCYVKSECYEHLKSYEVRVHVQKGKGRSK